MAKKKVNKPSYNLAPGYGGIWNPKLPDTNPTYPGYIPPINLGPDYGYYQVPGTDVLPPTTVQPTSAPSQLNYNPSYGTTPSPVWEAAEATGPGEQQPQQATWNPYAPVFQWDQDENGSWILVGVAPGVPQEAGIGVKPDWSSSYSPEYYKTAYKQPPLTAIWGVGAKRTMGTRGWRRPEPDRRSRWQKYMDELNATSITPAAAGAPVTWRT